MKINGKNVKVILSLTDENGNIVEDFNTAAEANRWCWLHGRMMSEFNKLWTAYTDDDDVIATGSTRNEALHNYAEWFLK
jgi:hypothetical protein